MAKKRKKGGKHAKPKGFGKSRRKGRKSGVSKRFAKGGGSTAARAKGHIPLKILERRAVKLVRIVEARRASGEK